MGERVACYEAPVGLFWATIIESTTASKAWKPGARGSASSRSGGVGRSVAGGQAHFQAFARGVEANEVHAGSAAGPDHRHVQFLGRGSAVGRWLGDSLLAGMRGDETARKLDGGPGWAVRLGAAVPFDDIRVVVGERSEEAGRLLDKSGEEHHAQAEAGRGDGRGARIGEDRGGFVAICGPVGRSDDKVTDPGFGGRSQIRQNGVALAEVEEDIRATEPVVGVAGMGFGHPEDRQGWRPTAREGGRDCATHGPVAGDDALHWR